MSLKRSIIVNPVHSNKKCQAKEEKQMGTVGLLRNEIHMQGETLPDTHLAYRIHVVTSFLQAGILLQN